jgi:hypothetical protein
LERRFLELETKDSVTKTFTMLSDGITAPTALTGWAKLYVDTADGDLKVRFGDNVTKTITTDT